MNELEAQTHKINDGSLPLEPYQLISRYTLEPLLCDIARETPNVVVSYAHELLSFRQDVDGVTVELMTHRIPVTLRATTSSAVTARQAQCASNSVERSSESHLSRCTRRSF